MTASIANFYQYGGFYECFIRVDNEDGRYYFKEISVTDDKVTDQNIELWKQLAIDEATTYWESL